MEWEVMGGIEMGVKKGMEFRDFERCVGDIVKIRGVGVMEGIVEKKKGGK